MGPLAGDGASRWPQAASNHAVKRFQKSALAGGAIFCIVRVVTLNPVRLVGRSMLKVASLGERNRRTARRSGVPFLTILGVTTSK